MIWWTRRLLQFLILQNLENIPIVDAEHYRHPVSLTFQKLLWPKEVSSAHFKCKSDNANQIAFHIVKHFNFNWPDMTVPSLDMMDRIVSIACNEIQSGGKVRYIPERLITCHLNWKLIYLFDRLQFIVTLGLEEQDLLLLAFSSQTIIYLPIQ